MLKKSLFNENNETCLELSFKSSQSYAAEKKNLRSMFQCKQRAAMIVECVNKCIKICDVRECDSSESFHL